MYNTNASIHLLNRMVDANWMLYKTYEIYVTINQADSALDVYYSVAND